jgi:cell division transport system ATP-binding protein
LIRLYKVTKRLGEHRFALRDVTLNVAPGEFVLVTGPTGSGKSTLLRILFGDEGFDSGRGIVNGRNLNRLDGHSLASLRRELGLVFQDSRLIDRLPIVDNVSLAAEVAGVARSEARARARQLLEMIGLGDHAEVSPLVLSSGERQRVCLARALVNNPALLLADEPTGSLDPDSSNEILDLLVEVNRSGTTVVVASHDQEALSFLRCRTLFMYEGRMIEEDQQSIDDTRIAADL